MYPPTYALLPWLQVSSGVPVVTRMRLFAGLGGGILPEVKVASPPPFDVRCLVHEECLGGTEVARTFSRECAVSVRETLLRQYQVALPAEVVRELRLDYGSVLLYAEREPDDLVMEAVLAKHVADAWEERGDLVEVKIRQYPQPEGSAWATDYSHRRRIREVLESMIGEFDQGMEMFGAPRVRRLPESW